MKARGTIILFLFLTVASARAATVTDLGPGFAWNVNNRGQVAGWETLDHAYVYRDGQEIQLMDGLSRATSINEKGQVAGYYLANNQDHAFLYSDGVMTDIVYGWYTVAYGLNDLGQVVDAFLWRPDNCQKQDCDYVFHAYVWQAGVFTDLNDLVPDSGWVLENALSINNKGQICGTGTINGEVHGFLLSL